MPAFVDTNVLLYAVSAAREESGKSAIARQILEGGDWRISVQVLQEFYVNAIRKLARPLSHTAALRFIQRLAQTAPMPVDLSLMLRSIRLSRRFQLSDWDGAIVAAAQIADCDTLYSEDLNHGQRFEHVEVVNPFRAVVHLE